ncbi:MAG: glycoside hydrolase family 3 C-terminal domain-containing protein [Clostridiales bacterium]|nr:glycoside hydrolase family 3 C-terminal domain-containing protein [Clostridiales bacterium]
MKKEKTPRSKQRLWRGLTSVTASLLALSVAASPIVESYRTNIDSLLGTSSTKVVSDDEDSSELYSYVSDYSSTTELVQAIADLGEEMSEEGTVLLKNENNALPLTEEETQKISLLGFSSYYPVMGGDMGSSLTENEGTDADTVDFVEALTAKGFTINSDLQALYNSLESTFVTEVESWGSTITYTHITAPSTDGVFTSKEPSQETMAAADADWQSSMDEYNVMIITITRSSGENRSYLPGEDGVDSSQDLNQTDPLGLSDDERDLIAAATGREPGPSPMRT